MAKIKCPKCGEVFTLDDQGYLEIVNQVRNQELEKELDARIKEVVEKLDLKHELEVKSLVEKKEKEIQELKLQNESFQKQEATKIELIETKAKSESNETIVSLKQEIEKLKNEINLSKASSELAIKQAINEKDQQINKLNSDILLKDKERELNEKTLQEQHALDIKRKDEEIAFYKDLKAKMSTKLVGETLEQHCQIQFNQLRTSAFPNAYFDKDNEVSKESNSKGDFIFRDYIDGIEYISIMFEMKNEADATKTKHKNEHFLEELDKDRKEKGCEYAVLVSLLEPDSEYYNAGIVDLSYKYERMYVIRPQCFISMITLLANAAKKTIDYKRQLVEARNQNLEVTKFEENLLDFKEKFDKNYQLAGRQFQDAIAEIDKTVDHLLKVKNNLLSSERNLRLANDKAQDLSIKQLTKNTPSIAEMFKNNKKD